MHKPLEGGRFPILAYSPAVFNPNVFSGSNDSHPAHSWNDNGKPGD
jgi:hypothetical protein